MSEVSPDLEILWPRFGILEQPGLKIILQNKLNFIKK